MTKVFLGMSGGVDSSTAAVLLREQGYTVHGLHLSLLRGLPLSTEHPVEDGAYQEGQTPNPCVVCNRRIKFGAMWDTARAMGADCLATGHYAKIGRDRATGRYVLRRGADRAKDQSYFLCRLTQEQLSRRTALSVPISGTVRISALSRTEIMPDSLTAAWGRRPPPDRF